MITFIDEEWRSNAMCRGSDVNKFFPPVGVSRTAVDEVKAICARCTVSAECLEYGLTEGNEDFGIFGGKTVRERRSIKAQRVRASRT